MELDSKPYGSVSSGRHLHVWGYSLTIWCFVLWIVFPALLVGLGAGVGIGYGAFHRDNPCDGYVITIDEMKDEYSIGIHPGGAFVPIQGRTPENECAAHYYEALSTVYADNVDTEGRRLGTVHGTVKWSKGIETWQQQQQEGEDASQNENVQVHGSDGFHLMSAVKFLSQGKGLTFLDLASNKRVVAATGAPPRDYPMVSGSQGL
jgi:hypothetical protein